MAEEYFRRAIEIDANNTEARLELAKIYEAVGQEEQAFVYVNEVMAIERNAQAIKVKKPRKRYRKRGDPPEPTPELPESVIVYKSRSRYNPRRLANPAEKLKDEMARVSELAFEHNVITMEREGMRSGDHDSVRKWMEAAKDMIDDFRGCKVFYPWDKFARYLGYTIKTTRTQPEVPLDPQLTEMADRLSTSWYSHIYKYACWLTIIRYRG